MMNGILLSHGCDAISVSARRMVEFYDTGDPMEMASFPLRDCAGLNPAWKRHSLPPVTADGQP
jgi:hypothetical protein